MKEGTLPSCGEGMHLPEMEEGHKLIPLGISMDYPVHWGFEKILRDLIQNFYDETGPGAFAREVLYEVEEDNYAYNLLLSMEGHLFSHEWLSYIGGSTKTKGRGNTIGKYGEGFKICCLSLLSLGIEDVTMHSGAWTLRPVRYLITIEGKEVPMLGYEYWEGEGDHKTWLRVRGIPWENKRFLDEGLFHFFYPENPLFGEELPQGRTRAFSRSSLPIPCQDEDPSFQGIFYYNNLARARLPFPFHLVYYKKEEKYDTRSRELLTGIYQKEITYFAFKGLSPEASLAILESMRAYWRELPKKKELINWYYHVCQLVRNVAASEECSKRFREKYGNLWYLMERGPGLTKDEHLEEASEWGRQNIGVFPVNPIFRRLGAKSILDAYQNSLGVGFRLPKGSEEKRVSLLWEAVPLLLSLPKEKYPPIYLYTGEQMPSPEQYLKKTFTKEDKKAHRKYQVTQMVLCPGDLSEDDFFPTLMKVCENLFLAYGKRRSSTFTLLLTNLGSVIGRRYQELKAIEERWKAISS